MWRLLPELQTAIFELADTDNIITYYLSGTSNASYVSESDIFSLNYGMKTYLAEAQENG